MMMWMYALLCFGVLRRSKWKRILGNEEEELFDIWNMNNYEPQWQNRLANKGMPKGIIAFQTIKLINVPLVLKENHYAASRPRV